MTREDLDLAQTHELVSALERRCDGMALIMCYANTDSTGYGNETIEYWALGGAYKALGLVCTLKEALLRGDAEVREEYGDDDDWKNGRSGNG